MRKTEPRGDHATGFYALERGSSGKIYYDKEPVKSSIYCNRAIWKTFYSSCDSDLLIGHCRQTSAGVGPERINRNNHPHVNHDKSCALVHNGRINEYSSLKSRYDLKSECDSEILLAMYEVGHYYKDQEEYLKQVFQTVLGENFSVEVASRLFGMKEIFSRVINGAMAVAIAERGDRGERKLILLGDGDRPLHLVDLRETIGQVFFFSTPDIFKNAKESCPLMNPYIPENVEFLVFPSHEVWMLEFDSGDWKIDKFGVKIEKYEYTGEDKPLHLSRKSTTPCSEVFSRLDDKEDIIASPLDTEEEKKNGQGEYDVSRLYNEGCCD